MTTGKLTDADIKTMLADVIADAQAGAKLNVGDADEYITACDVLSGIKARKKAVEAQKKVSITPLWKEYKEAMVPFVTTLSSIDFEMGILSGKVVGYEREQERLRRAKEDALRAAAKKEADAENRRKEREAKTQEKAGNDEEAMLLREEKVVPVMPTVPSYVPPVASVKHVETWDYEIVEARRIPREFLKVDEAAIKDYVKKFQAKAKIAGVRIFPVGGLKVK